MQHLETRCPAHIRVEVKPAAFLGFVAVATNERTHRRSEAVWGPSETDAAQRAEWLIGTST